MESVKRFGLWALISLIVFGVSHGQGNYLIFGGWIVLSLTAYILDCLRAPMRKCWRCKGTGNRRGWLFPSDTGACTACSGRSGRQPRVATYLLKLPRH